MMPFFAQNKVRPDRGCPKNKEVQSDEVVIEIEGVSMKMTRRGTTDVPAEVTSVIPRVEIRKKTYVNGQLRSEEEVILNSVTIVHAPRHPLAGESSPEEGEAPELDDPVVCDGPSVVAQPEVLRIPARAGRPVHHSSEVDIITPEIMVRGRKGQ